MHSNSDNIVFVPYNNANEVIDEIFESLFSKKTNWFRNISERKSDFLFHSVQLLYYKCHKINFKFGGLYIAKMTVIKTFSMQQQLH